MHKTKTFMVAIMLASAGYSRNDDTNTTRASNGIYTNILFL
jgi:hypothetical protein